MVEINRDRAEEAEEEMFVGADLDLVDEALVEDAVAVQDVKFNPPINFLTLIFINKQKKGI
jgi:hypothetical protein